MDFESRSERDLEIVGLDNYARDPSTEALLLAYALDDRTVKLCRPLEDGGLSDDLADLIRSPHIIKSAWNAAFERALLKYLFNIWVPYEQWEDPMVRARSLSMPGALDDVGKILRLRQDMTKLEDGKRLIKLFCEPKVKGGEDTFFGKSEAAFADKETHPADWALFEDYVKRDVVAEREILHKLAKFPLPPREQLVWYLDQKINDVGMPTDLELAVGAGKVADLAVEDFRRQLKELTGCENPNSNDQMLVWLQGQKYTFGSLGKPFVNRALAGECDLTDLGRKVLEIRQQASKTGYHKLTAIRDIVSADGRLRNQFRYMGAARTARWAGQDVQLQNLPRPTKEVEKRLDRALELLRAADYQTIKKEFACSPLDVVGSCLRPTFMAPEGKALVASDFSAIENRGLGWVARCQKILDVFLEGRDPYLSFAVDMYGIPYEEMVDEHGKPKPEYKDKRQNAKPAVLGAGYQLSGGEEVENEDGDKIRTGLWGYAQAMGVELTRDESHQSVAIFRQTYQEVVDCWYALERAAVSSFRTRQPVECGRCVFDCVGSKLLRVIMPSGRALHYIRPEVYKDTYIDRNQVERQKDVLTYEGIDQKTRVWTRLKAHGGKWMENIVQAIARELLAEAMLRADEAGFKIVGHVHDEIICEVPENSEQALADLEGVMSVAPAWAEGFPLAAEGWIGKRYRK